MSNETLLGSLSQRMKSDWDRRISSDHRYWMSDAKENDQAMWDAGVRDFEMLWQGVDLNQLQQSRAMEIGCGVGRLLRPASGVFREVYGFDVSEAAIEKSKHFLRQSSNVRTFVSDGVSFPQLSDKSIGAAYCFAVFGHVSSLVLSHVLAELSRVMKEGAYARLQFYRGEAALPVVEDTFSIRTYPEQTLSQIMVLLGFEVLGVRPLKLPFDATDPETGAEPVIFELQRKKYQRVDNERIFQELSRDDEVLGGEAWAGSQFEYQFAITRVNELVKHNQLRDARKLLRHAVSCFDNAEPKAIELLKELEALDLG